MNCTPVMLVRSLLVANLTLAGVSAAGAQRTDVTTVVRAARILDGRGGVIVNGAIVVRDGRIVDVARGSAAAAAAARAGIVVDLGGATVLPGLIDGHVHATQYFNASGR